MTEPTNPAILNTLLTALDVYNTFTALQQKRAAIKLLRAGQDEEAEIAIREAIAVDEASHAAWRWILSLVWESLQDEKPPTEAKRLYEALLLRECPSFRQKLEGTRWIRNPNQTNGS